MAEGLIMNQYSSNTQNIFHCALFLSICINATNDLDEQISIREHLT